MKKTAIALFLFAASTAHAGTFWHPEASSVVLAGPEVGTVCYYSSPTCVNAASCVSDWQCQDVFLNGGKDPVYFTVPNFGPVKVSAKWAYAVDGDGDLVPMVKE